MSENQASGKERYKSQREQIRAELEAFEGEGPPTAEELWHVAAYEAESAASWIHDMPVSENEIQTVRGDVLKALVALEMAEEGYLCPDTQDNPP